MNGPWPVALVGGGIIGAIIGVLIYFERLAILADNWANKRAAKKAAALDEALADVADLDERRQRNDSRPASGGCA